MDATLPASAWYGRDLEKNEDWIYHFSGSEIAELEECHARIAERGISQMDRLTKKDFSLPKLGAVLRDMAEEIESGRGFAFMRGLPVAQWGVAMSRLVYWGISSHIGVPIRQNARGEQLVPVMDVGVSKEKATARGPYGRGDLHFHSDFADVVGLMCVRTAMSGGVSRISSSRTILAHIRRERPDLLPVFENGFFFYRKGEEAVDETPVSRQRLPMLDWTESEPKFLFWPAFAKQGAQFSGQPLTPLETAALDFVNNMAHTPEVCLDTHFQPGDLQYLNNYKVLHSRTDFEDWPDASRKRYLERIWLRTDAGRAFPPRFADLHCKNSLVDGFPVLPAAVVAERERKAGVAA